MHTGGTGWGPGGGPAFSHVVFPELVSQRRAKAGACRSVWGAGPVHPVPPAGVQMWGDGVQAASVSPGGARGAGGHSWWVWPPSLLPLGQACRPRGPDPQPLAWSVLWHHACWCTPPVVHAASASRARAVLAQASHCECSGQAWVGVTGCAAGLALQPQVSAGLGGTTAGRSDGHPVVNTGSGALRDPQLGWRALPPSRFV